MHSFRVSAEADKNKILLLKRSQIDERFDAEYYHPNHYIDLDSLYNSPYELSTLNDICSRIVDGPFGSAIKASDYVEDGVPFIRVADVTRGEGTINTDNLIFISTEAHNKILRSKVVPDDIIIAKTGATMGAASVLPPSIPEANIRGDLGALTVKEELCLPKYLITFINTGIGQRLFWRLNSGGTRGRVVISNLKKYPILVPDIKVQKNIIAKMDFAYNAKKEKEKEAQAILDSIDDYLLDELGIDYPAINMSMTSDRVSVRNFKDISNDRFDPFYWQEHYILLQKEILSFDNVVYLKEVTELIESGSRPAGGVKSIESGILSLGGEHVNNLCEVTIKSPKYIPKDFHLKNKRTHTKYNDILLVKDGATTGKVGMINSQNLCGQNVNEHLFLIRVKKTTNAYFIMNYLYSKVGQTLLKRQITGATVTGLIKDSIRKVPIPLPKLNKQNEIADRIACMRTKAKALQEEANERLEEAKAEVEKMILEGVK